jgi:TonB family protein
VVVLVFLAAILQPPAGQARPPRPIAPLAGLFADEDYPEDALWNAQEGTVRFRLDVDSQGAPTRCTILESAGPALDKATCDLIVGRARFHPALDAHGLAAAGSYSSTAAWRLPRRPAIPFTPLRIANTIRATADGAARCSRDVDGVESSPAGIELCDVALAMGLADILSGGRVEGHLTVALTIVPDGAAAPGPDRLTSGTLLHRQEAAIVVTPYGQLSVCEVIPDRRPVRWREMHGLDLCMAYLGRGGPLFAAETDAGGRAARIMFSIYAPAPTR